MKNTRLIRLFNVLDAAEKRKLRRMLEASDKSKDVQDLCAYLTKYADKAKRLDKEVVFKSIYSLDVPFDDRKLGQLRFQLYHLIEDFIVIEQLTRKGDNKTSRMVQRELLLLEYMDEKVLPDDQHSDDLSKLTTQKINDLSSLLEDAKERDIFHYLNLYHLNYHLYYTNMDKWQQGQPYIEALMKNLDTFYCLAKLRYANELLMRKKILNEDASILLLDEVRDYGKLLAEEAVLMADIYQMNLDLLEAFDEEKFYTLKKQILTHADKFEKKELSYLIFFLINHATQATRQSDIDLTISSYEIYKLGLDKEAFTEKGFIRPLSLLNYALLSSEVGEANEIPGILTQYQDKIKEPFKVDTLRLCQAYQCFGEHDFYGAYTLIDDNSKRSLSFGLHQKSLQLKCLYELENSSSTHPYIERTLHDACMAYRRYIQRKSADLGETASKAHLNFVDILLKLNNPNTKKEVYENAMKDKHNQTVHKNWLARKIKEKR